MNDPRSQSERRAFTLTELMIATVVLLIVVIATSKIFGTASDVAGIGEASADILQEAAAIEQQIRTDFARLNYGGFFAIQSHAVRNDANATTTGALLDPNKSPSYLFRSDQLIFFISGVQNTRNYNLNAFESTRKQQSSAARLYYGHAFQLPDAPLDRDPDEDWQPWRADRIDLYNRSTGNRSTFDVPLVPPTQWLLSRQAILLADDGGSTDSYYGSQNSYFSIWNNAAQPWASPRNGRRDIAAATIDDIRRDVLNNLSNPSLGWLEQSARIINTFYFPRAERVPPVDPGSTAANTDFVRREDHALTTHAIGSACSSFIVEWTYRDGAGAALADNGDFLRGVVAPVAQPQPWFGYRDPALVSDPDDLENGADPERNVFRYQDWSRGGRGAWGVDPFAIERPMLAGGQPGVIRYRAVFGYNRDNPVMVNNADTPDPRDGYTPWPDALRITMILHDPRGRLANGRTFQFIVKLPEREP